MNPLRVSAFQQKAAAALQTVFGTMISINGGAQFLAAVSMPQPSLDLEMGGFSTRRSIRLRWPLAAAPRPSVGAQILLVSENVTYRVETAVTLAGSPVHGHEVTVTAVRE